jgi:hypothetical protein
MSNDFQTPAHAVYPLFKYISKAWRVWECSCGRGNIIKSFSDKGYSIFGTDILSGYDFLKYEPDPKTYECIVTNPPYSLKQQFLERAYQLGKPFAFLLPLTTFETGKRQALFDKYGVQVLFFDRRINFETPSGNGSGAWFATAWFTYGFNLPKQLTFERLDQ